MECCIRTLLSERAASASICPSDAARSVAQTSGENWRDLMPLAREVAVRMALAGSLRITRKQATLDPRDLGPGPIRLRLPDQEGVIDTS
ncbi:MAG: DUF3253 domain-containing protein [Rhodococcus sp. (in: high G+C Gram-positive bacteria)]|nr:MAG: DUF3253 domain-containing protein [Rhodococcus sp. (in: high G+C Gram-positive bacteria)]